MLHTQAVRGQNCVPGSLVVFPGEPDEKLVHLGDKVHFYVSLGADSGSCLLDSGMNWAILPDGTVHLINENYSKSNCGRNFSINCPMDNECVGDIPVAIGPSGFLKFEYGPITAEDVGRSLPLFVTPRGSIFTEQL